MKQQTSLISETGYEGKKHTNYSGQTIYVGIDVHQKDYQVAKVLNGICLGNHRMNRNNDGLIEHLRSRYPGAAFKCVYESCAWGFELQRALSAAGMECIVVHAADVSSNDKERKRKTDKVDALKLAQTLASGILKGIHVPQKDIQQQRNLIRYRKRLAGDINRTKKRLKSLLKYQGIEIPEAYGKNNWSRNFLSWITRQTENNALLKDTLLMMVEQVNLLRHLLLKTERSLRAMRKQEQYEPKVALAMSVPGVGPTTAMLFLLEVGDIHRCKGFDALNDFIGFCPDTHSSGDKERSAGLTTRRHKQLRSALIEAAWVAIRVDPAMMQCYQLLTKRMKGTYAIIRIARKLLRRLRAVLISGQPYQKGIIA